MNEKKFKLCITMAGAVSAGAYTAGVLDYLLETLQLWEAAKEKNRNIIKNGGTPESEDYDKSVPMHDVEIDVMSGASAGGISGTLTMLSLLDAKHTPVNSKNPDGKHNRFYQSWVEMADDQHSDSLTKLLQRDDIKGTETPESLLNTKAIEAIADKALVLDKQNKYPPFVSKSLDLILTTSNLRGINFKVNFDGSAGAGTVITNHGGFFRYKVMNDEFPHGVPDNGPKDDRLYYVFDPLAEKDVEYIKNATLSTAAFPIGLKSREIEISRKYVERYPKYLFGRRDGIEPIMDGEEIYRFNSIDGGLINNEPFGIGLKVINEKNPEIEQEKSDNYAVIMVDPFPNHDHDMEPYESKRDMLSIGKGMFKALRNQVMFNQDGILDALSLSDRTKFLIAPSRKVKKNVAGHEKWVHADNHLASAPISGFAGFFDKKLREHDFKLGRLNCQIFLRYYFAVKQENIEKRFNAGATEASLERFKFAVPPKDETGDWYYPIIPDMKVIKAFDGQYDTENYAPEDAYIPYPEYPSFNMSAFEKKYKRLLKKRISSLVRGISGNRLLTTGFNWFYRGKTYKMLLENIEKELRKAKLIR